MSASATKRAGEVAGIVAAHPAPRRNHHFSGWCDGAALLPFSTCCAQEPEAQNKETENARSELHEVTSLNGEFWLIYQDDGNLVLYWNDRALWASATNGNPGGSCLLQDDGNLVIRNAAGAVIWSTNTAGNPGNEVWVTDEGGAFTTKGGWSTRTRVDMMDT